VGKSPRTGHYWAKIKQEDGRWLKFNDSFVSETRPPLTAEDSRDTYMAFYRVEEEYQEARSDGYEGEEGQLLLDFAVPPLPPWMEW
jgi:hypothetical protein